MIKTKFSFFIFVFLCVTVFLSLSEKATARQLEYAWPFVDQTVPFETKDKAPIIVELFSTQACLFCPVADQFFNDLVTKTPIIGLACHIDYFDVEEGSISRPICTARQEDYAGKIEGSMTYTPQMVVNGHLDVVGYEFDNVAKAFKKAAQDPLIALQLERGTNPDLVTLRLPNIKLEKPAQIWIALTRAPLDLTISEGANRGQKMRYLNIVDKMSMLETWDGNAKTLTFRPLRGADTERVIVLVQDQKGILAAGQLALP